MSKEILEDMQQAPNVGAGGAKAKLEKQARQLAYDTKYKVKQALSAKSGGKADPAAVAKMYLAQLAKSPAPPAIKALAKKKLMGEEYVDVKGFVVDSVTDALLKVFVEKKDDTVEEVIEEEKGEQKFHIKVTDKKTGNTYHRYATRAKISELRANSNIATVEMSHQGESGTKAKKDYDGDGKVESSSKEHAGAVHNAIQKAKGGTPDGKDTRKEEVEITEKKHEEGKIGGGNIKKLAAKANKRIDADVDGDVDTDDPKSTEMGEFIPSPDGKRKIKTKIQKEDYISNWRDEILEGKDEDGADKDATDKDVDVMKGKNKIKVMPELGESAEVCEKCGKNPCECDKEDPRGMNTKVNLMRNKLRAMGLKMSHEPEGEMIEQVKPETKEDEKKSGPTADENQMIAKKRQMMLKTQMIQKQKLNLQKQGKLPITSEEVEYIDEISQKTATRAYSQRATNEYETDSDSKKSDAARGRIERKFGKKAGQHADRAAHALTFGRKSSTMPKKPANEEVETVSEEGADAMKDRRMERGGVDGNNRYNKPVSNTPNTFGKKKPKYDGMSAIEKVKASIRAKHGQGAIIDTKKK